MAYKKGNPERQKRLDNKDDWVWPLNFYMAVFFDKSEEDVRGIYDKIKCNKLVEIEKFIVGKAIGKTHNNKRNLWREKCLVDYFISCDSMRFLAEKEVSTFGKVENVVEETLNIMIENKDKELEALETGDVPTDGLGGIWD